MTQTQQAKRPPKGKVTFRVDPTKWEAAIDKAAVNDDNLSQLFRDALDVYLGSK